MPSDGVTVAVRGVVAYQGGETVDGATSDVVTSGGVTTPGGRSSPGGVTSPGVGAALGACSVWETAPGGATSLDEATWMLDGATCAVSSWGDEGAGPGVPWSAGGHVGGPEGGNLCVGSPVGGVVAAWKGAWAAWPCSVGAAGPMHCARGTSDEEDGSGCLLTGSSGMVKLAGS